MRLLRGALLLILLPAPGAAALFQAGGEGLLGARAAGAAGALASTGPALEALLYNPAALPQDEALHWGVFSGQAEAGRSLGSAGLSVSLDEGLRLGLLYDSHSDAAHSGLQEQTYAALLSLGPPGRWSLGLRAKAHQLRAPGLGDAPWGGGVDLGLLSAPRRLFILPGAWTVGASVDQALTAWSEPGFAQALPMTLRAGLGWQPLKALRLGGEGVWHAGSDGQAWRAGAEWALPAGLALRGGWRSEDGGQWTAGAGAGLPWGGLGLDYAYLSQAPLAPAAHRLSLHGAWDIPRPYRLRLATEQLLSDPDSGLILQARFKVSLDPRLQGRAWTLELLDPEGQVLDRLRPAAPGDLGVDWDGLTRAGLGVDARAGLRAVLRVALDHGEIQETFTVLAPGRVQAAAEVEPTPEPVGDQTLPQPVMKPVFADEAGKQLSHVVLQLPGAAAVDAKAWKLDIQDAARRSLRVLKGEGALPDELIWDGRDEKGRQVEDALGVRMKLQVQDREGRRSERELPLFTQKAYEIARQEARERPELRLASLGLPLLLDRQPLRYGESLLPMLMDQARRAQARLSRQQRYEQDRSLSRNFSRQDGQAWMLDLFETAGDRPLAARMSLLRDASESLDAGGRTLMLTGLALAKEPQARDLARRRSFQTALALLKRRPDRPLLLAPPPPPGDFKGVRLAPLHEAGDEEAWQALGSGRRTQALARAQPGQLQARYAAQELDRQPEQGSLAPAPRRLDQVLKPWGLRPGAGTAQAWNAATGKLAFYHQGWIWITDKDGSSLRGLWYEPDLQAAGRLRFDKDGTRLWIRADAWRRWLSLDLHTDLSKP